MAKGNVKLFATTTAFFAVFAIIFFTLSITAIGKFTAQKKRVHHMEQQILAGKTEILKVPTMIGELRKADKEKKQLNIFYRILIFNSKNKLFNIIFKCATFQSKTCRY